MGLILKYTLQHMKVADIDFHSEIGGLGWHTNATMYHKGLGTSDCEISMVYGFMLWKGVAGNWLIEIYANCDATESIQKAFDWFSRTVDVDKAIKYFRKDSSDLHLAFLRDS